MQIVALRVMVQYAEALIYYGGGKRVKTESATFHAQSYGIERPGRIGPIRASHNSFFTQIDLLTAHG